MVSLVGIKIDFKGGELIVDMFDFSRVILKVEN